MNLKRLKLLVWCGVLIWIFTLSCTEERPTLSSLFTPLSARTQYERFLKKSDVYGKKVLAQWDSISNRALQDSLFIEAPYRQTGYFLADRMEVLTFLIPLKKGEAIDIEINTDSTDNQVFMDFFRIRRGKWKPVLKTKKAQKQLHYEVPETETYLLRIQPELSKFTAYELKIMRNPVYAFPVTGKSNPDVWSFWGDPRDGGRRKHKGIDIFAKRGTPLIAITEGYAAAVRDEGLGGKQVWIRDLERKNALYYAHLDKQLVTEGQYVMPGDTIGLVGNTGNARNTRPHLHFGIYIRGRGPVDPLPYVYQYSNKFAPSRAKIKADYSSKGITQDIANLRSKPSSKESLLKKIAEGSPVELLGASGNWYHVRTMEGEVGFIHHTSIQQLEVRTLS